MLQICLRNMHFTASVCRLFYIASLVCLSQNNTVFVLWCHFPNSICNLCRWCLSHLLLKNLFVINLWLPNTTSSLHFPYIQLAKVKVLIYTLQAELHFFSLKVWNASALVLCAVVWSSFTHVVMCIHVFMWIVLRCELRPLCFMFGSDFCFMMYITGAVDCMERFISNMISCVNWDIKTYLCTQQWA